MPFTNKVTLYGRIFIRGNIHLVTGLHIGGGKETLQIGGVDNIVVRASLDNRPYIPGSSLRGKMRSLWEKRVGAEQLFPIRRGQPKVYIHICDNARAYADCLVCRIFGVPGDKSFSSPTRLIVRDIHMSDEQAKKLDAAKTDLPYTEVKWEAAIDRVTSAAVPRQMERVPAGTVFEGLEMVFSLFEAGDIERFVDVFRAMQLLEDDYLGGQGSRGSGKIRFEDISIACRNSETYEVIHEWPEKGIQSVQQVLDMKDALVVWLKEMIPVPDPQPTP